MVMIVSGAYGRDYKSKAAAVADWDAGKDFVIRSFGPDSGRYVNKPAVAGSVNIRYANDRKVAVAKGGK